MAEGPMGRARDRRGCRVCQEIYPRRPSEAVGVGSPSAPLDIIPQRPPPLSDRPEARERGMQGATFPAIYDGKPNMAGVKAAMASTLLGAGPFSEWCDPCGATPARTVTSGPSQNSQPPVRTFFHLPRGSLGSPATPIPDAVLVAVYVPPTLLTT
jgi:hypothetical protein